MPLLPSALWRVTPGPRNRSDACDRPRADRVHYQARAPRRGAAARPMIVPGQRHPFKRPVSGRNPEESPAAFGPGSSVVAPAGAPLPGLGHRGPNSGETPRRSSLRQSPVVVAAGLFAACWLCFLALDALLRRRPEHIDVTGMNSLLTTCAGVAAVVLGTLSVAQWRAFRLDRSAPGPARAWGIVAAGLAQAALALVLVPGEASVWALGAHVLALVGILCGLMMGAREFSERAARQQSQLIESVRAASTDAARRQARLVLESGHRHDLRSALFVIDGAASALVERSAELGEADRLSVGRLVAAGVGHLSGLIETCIEEIQPVAVDRLAMAVAHSERRSGMAVASDVPQGLTATGRAVDLGVVLRILLRSTAAATEGPVKVRGESGDGTVTLFVEPDGGPAHCRAAAADWKLVPFDRQKSGLMFEAESAEVALRYEVAARLMADQGGDVWTTTPAGGRIAFAVRLPAAPTLEESV